MSITEKDILQGIKDLRLSEKKRTLMRSELSAYADLHSMPSVETASFNSIAFLGNIFTHSRVLMAATLAFVLVVTGGSATASAAENAVPGEALYGVKVLVNEPIASVFAGTGASKARYHAKLAVRRVEEAEVLESRGAFTPEYAAELTERFVDEAEKAEAEVARLESKGDVSASLAIRSELASDLSLHVAVPIEEETVALAKGAAAPTLMKVSAEVADEVTVPDEKVAFQTLIATRVASLRERHAAPPIFIADEDDNDETDEEVGIATAQARSAKHSLLSGTSVASTDASTTASSSPLEGKRLLKTLLRAHQNSEDREGTSAEVSGKGDGDTVLDASALLAPVENPNRLIPRSTLPAE